MPPLARTRTAAPHDTFAPFGAPSTPAGSGGRTIPRRDPSKRTSPTRPSCVHGRRERRGDPLREPPPSRTRQAPLRMVTPSSGSSCMPTLRVRPVLPPPGEESLLRGDTGLAVIVLSVGYLWMLLWLGSDLAATIGRTAWPPFSVTGPFLAFAHLGNPSLAWGRHVADPWSYWTCTGVVLAVGLGLPTWLWVLSRRSSATQKSDPGTILGVASGAEVKAGCRSTLAATPRGESSAEPAKTTTQRCGLPPGASSTTGLLLFG